jgi:hypothetical protein
MNVEHDEAGFIIFRDDPYGPDEAKGSASEDREWLNHIRSREFAERAAAKHATCSRARHVHQELAQAYARMIRRAGHE